MISTLAPIPLLNIVVEVTKIEREERILSYLPLSHIAGCMLDIFMAIYAGNQVHFADKEVLKTTLVDNLKKVKPTKLVAVPRVYEKIAEKMQEAGKANSSVKKVVLLF